MITYIIWFASCSVACLLGFIVGRCFQDFAGIAATQDLIAAESENDQLRQTIADLRLLLVEGERALDLLDQYRQKVTEANEIESGDFRTYKAVE